jgi:hypothetical protein
MRYDLTDNMTEEMIGRNHHKEKKKNFHSIGVKVLMINLFNLIMESCSPWSEPISD